MNLFSKMFSQKTVRANKQQENAGNKKKNPTKKPKTNKQNKKPHKKQKSDSISSC